MTGLTGRPLRVAAAVIRRPDGSVLLGRRAPERHQGGLWEFPGGKLERCERQIDALARELHEELGISIARGVPLIRVVHEYSDRAVDLEVLEVEAWDGEPTGREGQPLRWVPPAAFGDYDFPAANLPITTAASLPRLALVTPALEGAPAEFLERLEHCLDAGVRLVQLRLLLDDRPLARRVHADAVRLCDTYGARALVDDVPGEALLVNAHGLHLSAPRLLQLSARPLGGGQVLSASCHGAGELAHAARLGADFCYVAPVHDSSLHPGAQTLGWHGLRRLVRGAAIPVYALGGMRAADMRLALRAGCQGVAMSSGLWEAPDPAAVVRAAASAARESAYEVTAQR